MNFSEVQKTSAVSLQRSFACQGFLEAFYSAETRHPLSPRTNSMVALVGAP
jgi:hypothetical protein